MLKCININMPIIQPTNYMFEKYSYLGKEKWEIYAEVTRKIFCEIGGFKECTIFDKWNI